MKKIKVLQAWRDATEELTKVFVKKYFPSEVDSPHNFWVGNRIGDIYFVSDMFFDVDRIIEALELNATYEQLRDYHDLETDDPYNPIPINFKNYVKYGRIDEK